MAQEIMARDKKFRKRKKKRNSWNNIEYYREILYMEILSSIRNH